MAESPCRGQPDAADQARRSKHCLPAVHRGFGVLARDPSIPIFARSEEGGKQRIDTKPQNCWDGRFAYPSQGLFISLK
jgi:hypothetical protein